MREIDKLVDQTLAVHLRMIESGISSVLNQTFLSWWTDIRDLNIDNHGKLLTTNGKFQTAFKVTRHVW